MLAALMGLAHAIPNPVADAAEPEPTNLPPPAPMNKGATVELRAEHGVCQLHFTDVAGCTAKTSQKGGIGKYDGSNCVPHDGVSASEGPNFCGRGTVTIFYEDENNDPPSIQGGIKGKAYEVFFANQPHRSGPNIIKNIGPKPGKVVFDGSWESA